MKGLNIEKSCCFTGHRNRTSFDFDEQDRLRDEIENLIQTKGVELFITGGALGFDTLAAQTVLSLKKRYPFIKLMLALPCVEQADRWSANEQLVYNDIKKRADIVHYVNRVYSENCMIQRNDFMLENAKYCICYLRQLRGGTYYTAQRAKKLGRVLITL